MQPGEVVDLIIEGDIEALADSLSRLGSPDRKKLAQTEAVFQVLHGRDRKDNDQLLAAYLTPDADERVDVQAVEQPLPGDGGDEAA